MERALAVVDASEAAKDLVREAGELAGGVGAGVVLVHVTTEEEYENQLDALEEIPSADVSYGITQAKDGARSFAADIGREVLGDLDLDVEAVGRVGNRKERILETAEEYGCDHIFIAGRKRSPTGKAVFGDLTQKVILDFDGAVTVLTV